MPSKRRSFQRPLGKRRYRRLFIIAVEGSKTEPQYFHIFNSQNSVIQVKCIKSKKESDPIHVLKRMIEYLKEEVLRQSDEAWLVVDKDKWTEAQLQQLLDWSSSDARYGFVLSNPNFEYWLLLHFEDGTGISGSQEIHSRLEQWLPNYDKSIDARKISRDSIDAAILRARNRDNPPCSDWPHNIGTTVYKLAERLLRD
jgi:hypothetical protein